MVLFALCLFTFVMSFFFRFSPTFANTLLRGLSFSYLLSSTFFFRCPLVRGSSPLGKGMSAVSLVLFLSSPPFSAPLGRRPFNSTSQSFLAPFKPLFPPSLRFLLTAVIQSGVFLRGSMRRTWLSSFRSLLFSHQLLDQRAPVRPTWPVLEHLIVSSPLFPSSSPFPVDGDLCSLPLVLRLCAKCPQPWTCRVPCAIPP